MSGFIGGIVALLVGGGLATATVVGVVQTRATVAEEALQGEGVQSAVIDYGTNQG